MKPLDYDISAIEAAALALLLPLRTAGTIRTLESYGGQLDVDDIGRLTLLFPAVYVVWSGVQVQAYGSADGLTCGLSAIVCDHNLRGAASARSGDSSSIGIYSLLGSIRAILHGAVIDRQFYQAQLVREAPLAYDPKQGLAIYEALYELRRRT